MLEPGRAQQRISIPFFEGVNSLVSFNLGKKTEFVHAENARSKTIGTIEKREGQTVLGTNSQGKPFVTTDNYGIFPFQEGAGQGLYRISVPENPTLSINVCDNIFVHDTTSNTATFTGNTPPAVTKLMPLSISVIDRMSVSEKVNDLPGKKATIYYIDNGGKWIPLTGKGANIPGGMFSYTYAEGCVFIVNQNSDNRYIDKDGITVKSSTEGDGHLYMTPPASKINYYKDRLYAADYIQSGIRYPTTVLRSSEPLGIVALINADYNNLVSGSTIDVTDVKYFYADALGVSPSASISPSPSRSPSPSISPSTSQSNSPSSSLSPSGSQSGSPSSSLSLSPSTSSSTSGSISPSNSLSISPSSSVSPSPAELPTTPNGAFTYDIYRGQTFIKSITVVKVNATSIVATWNGTLSVLASDEIWVGGTYTGKKLFRWINNPTVTARDVKQYDTFRLAGGQNEPVTMLTNIGNVMMIANKNTMSSWNNYTLENFDLNIGNVSEKGFVKMGGVLYFLHYTGVFTTTGGIPTLISSKLQKYVEGATRGGLESSCAGKKGRSVFFTLGDVTLYKNDGSVNKVLKDTCIEYNLTQENWYVHTNVKASEFATFVEQSNPDRLVFIDTEGNHSVKEFLSGETDDGKNIHFRVDTMKLTIQPTNFEYLSKLIAILTEVERGTATKVFVNLENNEEYYQLEGDMAKGLSVIKVTDKDNSRGKPPVARLVSISLRDSSKQLCKISRMTISHLPTTDENVDNEG